MLEAAGLTFEVVPADVDEAAIKRDLLGSGATPPAIAERLAAAKAEAVSARLPRGRGDRRRPGSGSRPGTVQQAGRLAEAREQLLRLRGKTHQLHTALPLRRWKSCLVPCGIATPTMRPFSEAFLDRLSGRGRRPRRHTVGAYEIEGPGIQLFERIEGDLFTIIGLPLLPLLAELRARGVIDA